MESGKMFVVGVVLVSLFVSVVMGGEVKDVQAPCGFPAIFNFGDSNSDTGGFAAGFGQVPEGSNGTLFGKPSGRACDGRLVIDFIAEKLGLPYLSAYLDSIDSNFTQGVNFAVSASTIRVQNDTSNQPCFLEIQTNQYKRLKARTCELQKAGNNTSRLPRPEDFSKALYTIDIGQNDVTRDSAAIPDMIDQYAKAVKCLYDQGARTFWIHNVGPIGCLKININPMTNKTKGAVDQYGCVKSYNEAAMKFNKQLKDRVVKLRTEIPEAVLTHVDIYTAKFWLITNAKNLGFVEAIEGCKVPPQPTCANPEKYVSWDNAHFSEAANRLIAERIINGSLSDPPVPVTHACYKNVTM